ncbi:MAG: universal stress protein [Tuberibacillus sp.]
MYHLVTSILVAIDGSRLSKKALKFAENIAKTNENIELKLLTVKKNDYFPLVYPEAMVYFDEVKAQELDEEINKMLLEAKNGLNIENKVTTHVVSGSPGPAITEFANENNIDLIVMGSRGLGSVKAFFLGSVSHYVVQTAKCPVLIVK